MKTVEGAGVWESGGLRAAVLFPERLEAYPAEAWPATLALMPVGKYGRHEVVHKHVPVHSLPPTLRDTRAERAKGVKCILQCKPRGSKLEGGLHITGLPLQKIGAPLSVLAGVLWIALYGDVSGHVLRINRAGRLVPCCKTAASAGYHWMMHLQH